MRIETKMPMTLKEFKKAFESQFKYSSKSVREAKIREAWEKSQAKFK